MADSWSDCFGILLHEVFELGFIDLNTRYTSNPRFSNSAADYLFVATHEQFGEVAERAGNFVARVSEPLRAAALKYQAEQRAKQKKINKKQELKERLAKKKKKV